MKFPISEFDDKTTGVLRRLVRMYCEKAGLYRHVDNTASPHDIEQTVETLIDRGQIEIVYNEQRQEFVIKLAGI